MNITYFDHTKKREEVLQSAREHSAKAQATIYVFSHADGAHSYSYMESPYAPITVGGYVPTCIISFTNGVENKKDKNDKN